MNKPILILSAFCILITFLSCSPDIPDGATAVSPFDPEKYLGKWYEIARIDFKHEKDLNNTTAEYSLKEDGSIQVLNRGYNTKKQEWEKATGAKVNILSKKNHFELDKEIKSDIASGSINWCVGSKSKRSTS